MRKVDVQSGHSFAPITIPMDGGGRRRVHRIACSRCPSTFDVSANTHSGSRNHDDLARVFARNGWTLGRNRLRDLCPACSGKGAKAAPAPVPQPTPTNPLPSNNAEVIPMVASKSAAEPPRKPTFDERRIIFAKLEEAYLDENRGYDTGWSDRKVAEDLGVPRAWVSEIREQNFGPLRDTEEVRVVTEEARKLVAEARELHDEAIKMRGVFLKAAESLNAKAEKIAADIATAEKRMADIERVMR